MSGAPARCCACSPQAARLFLTAAETLIKTRKTANRLSLSISERIGSQSEVVQSAATAYCSWRAIFRLQSAAATIAPRSGTKHACNHAGPEQRLPVGPKDLGAGRVRDEESRNRAQIPCVAIGFQPMVRQPLLHC